eukprot:TRINITY_DN10450_c2_g1_i2.p1 TRINITY_DN10450_c2_g1~~TRINITY_DN10450_c2_g1_i2.p1  ORF type:complete len:404 (+),score=79.17 TRINITY_DN10450_c2_g1_i2:382-1593(+)
MHLVRIAPGGPCDRAGMSPGVLVTLNGIEINSVEDLRDAVASVRSQGLTRVEALHIPDAGVGADNGPSTYEPPARLHALAASGVAGRLPNSGGPASPPNDFEIEPQDEEERLASKLRGLAVLRQRGQINEQTYQDHKRQILTQLGAGALTGQEQRKPGRGQRTPAAATAAAATRQPPKQLPPVLDAPSSWARLIVPRYVFPRAAPFRGAAFVPGTGVTGTVHVEHLQGAFALVHAESGTKGYIQTKYLQFLSQHHRRMPVKAASPLLSGYAGQDPLPLPPAPPHRPVSEFAGPHGWHGDAFGSGSGWANAPPSAPFSSYPAHSSYGRLPAHSSYGRVSPPPFSMSPAGLSGYVGGSSREASPGWDPPYRATDGPCAALGAEAAWRQASPSFDHFDGGDGWLTT